MKPAHFSLPRHWPGPYDAAAADRLAERFQSIGATQAGWLNAPGVLPMLR